MSREPLRNIFGDPITLPPARGKRYRKANGYAAPPGTGPDGETCKTCQHYTRTRSGSGKTYPKCGLMVAHWTGGRGSDILARSPACRNWQEKEST